MTGAAGRCLNARPVQLDQEQVGVGTNEVNGTGIGRARRLGKRQGDSWAQTPGQFSLKEIAQTFHLPRVQGGRLLRRHAKTHHGGNVFRSGTAPVFLGPTPHKGFHGHAATQEKCAHAFGTMDLVGGKTGHVQAQGARSEGHFAKGLHGIAVNQNAPGLAVPDQVRQREQGARFVVGKHGREQKGGVVQRVQQRLEIYAAPAQGYGHDLHLKPQAFAPVRRLAHGRVLHRGDDQFLAFFLPRGQCRAHDGQIVRLGAAAGKNDLKGGHAERLGHLVARPFHRRPGTQAHLVNGTGVAEFRAQKRLNGLYHLRPGARGGVVVEINAMHRSLPRLYFSRYRMLDRRERRDETVAATGGSMSPIFTILFLLPAGDLAQGNGDAPRSALPHPPRLIVLGFDGADFNLVNRYLEQGLLPHLAELRRRGGYTRLEPTNPPQTPVSWSTFATGLDPGQTGIQDFIDRKPGTYLPQYALQAEGRKTFLFGRHNTLILPLLAAAGCLVLGPALIFLFRRRSPGAVAWSALAATAVSFALLLWFTARRYLPESVPSVHTVRLGEPLWSILSKAGKKSTIVRLPVTFPAEPLKGRMIAGLPTPDIRGTIGKPTIYTNDPFFQSGDNTFSVEIRILGGDPPYRSEILGPANKLFFDEVARQEAERLGKPYLPVRDFSAPLEIEPGPPFTLRVQGQTITLETGHWSPYVTFRYPVNPLITLKGFGRFYLAEQAPFFKLYLGPINLHPDLPLPLSYPANLAGELFEADPYETIGWAIDTWSISSGLMDEEHFLADLDHTVSRYEKLLHQLLENSEDDLYLQVFSFTDLIGHVLMRFMDDQHPLHEPQKAATYQRVMQQAYQRMDAIVGRLMDRLDLEKSTLIVLSDHGFASFRRQFNLNTYLVEQGYLVLKRNVLGEPMQLDDLQTGSTPFQHVDWSRTRAYAMGLGMVFLNVKGREPQGIVAEAERMDLAREIAQGLQNYVDEHGHAPIRRVYLREELYSSFDADTCADLRVANAAPYRVSWDTTLGGMPLKVVEDNRHKWSGDHCSLDPDEVPGILFSSIPLASWIGDPAQPVVPAMIDVCPSLLALLGVDPPKTMRGRMLFSPR